MEKLQITDADPRRVESHEFVVFENIPAHQEQAGNGITDLFDKSFFDDDLSISMNRVGGHLANLLKGHASDQTREALLEFGTQIVPILEIEYSDAVHFQPEFVASRIAHTIIAAQNKIHLDAAIAPLPLNKRMQMLFDFSRRLELAEKGNKVISS